MTKSDQFKVFISSTSDDFGNIRDDIANWFVERGAHVDAQRQYADTLNNGYDIRNAIKAANLIICIVGHCYGTKAPSRIRGRNIPEDASWAQWELCYALDQHRPKLKQYQRKFNTHTPAKPHFLIYFAHNSASLPQINQSEEHQKRQAIFRDQIMTQLNHTFGTDFYESFDNEEKLKQTIISTCEKRKSLFSSFQLNRWEAFKAMFKSHCNNGWNNKFPDRLRLSCFGANEEEQLGSEKLFDRSWPKEHDQNGRSADVLIDNQPLDLVVPDERGMQLDSLRRHIGVGGREPSAGRPLVEDMGFDTLVKGLTGDQGASKRLDAPCQKYKGRRIAFINVAGVGKTTLIERLQYETNRSPAHFAVKLEAIDFICGDGEAKRKSHDDISQALCSKLKTLGIDDWVKRIAVTEPYSLAKLVEYGLEREAAAGHLSILIDGLDHVDTKLPAIVQLQTGRNWEKTHVVLAGRLQALNSWVEGGEEHARSPDIRYWRFIAPAGVTEKQAKAYLGGFHRETDGDTKEKVWRFDLLHRNLGNLLFIPRLLAHARTIENDKLSVVRTAAGIFDLAVRHLLTEGLSKGGEKSDGDTVERFLTLLSALAFQSMFRGTSGLRENESAGLLLRKDDEEAFFDRVKQYYGVEKYDTKRDAFKADLKELLRLSTLVGNGLLDTETGIPDRFSKVLWTSRTVQQFLAARWLACHARPDDSQWFHKALFYPHAENTDSTEELNQFLAEMPPEQINLSSWVNSARAWYDPALVRDQGSEGLWSTEMIARSWRLMHAVADRQVDDWWDVSYDVIFATPAGCRGSKSLHPRIEISLSDPVVKAAGEALDGFLGDFEGLRGTKGEEGERVRHFVTNGWCDVPAGKLRMGSPPEQQGFPPKTLAFWKEMLAKVAGDEQPDTIAWSASPEAWWTGPYGRRQCQDERNWLENTVFRPYAREVATAASPEKRVAAEKAALDKLETNFRRPDETPVEADQPIKSATFCAVPVVNAVYALFSPGHVQAVKKAMESSQRGQVSADPSEGTPYASDKWIDPQRPALCITWFDAWAFAQWARWSIDGTRYGCRLPHEPEWEFACKHEGLVGRPMPTPFGQRYWWGTAFYANYNAGKEEPLSKPEAHAVGWPGATRDPDEASPNGLELKDMIGNVWEWCANVYDIRTEADIRDDANNTGYSRTRPEKDNLPAINAPRSMRGGIWYYLNHLSTAASRFRLPPNDGDYKTGFRLVREKLN